MNKNLSPVKKLMRANLQKSLAGNYPAWVRWLSILGFSWATLGWLNESLFKWVEAPLLLSHFTEYAIILAFGIWRIFAEKNSYTKNRLIVLVSCVTVLWWLIPWLLPVGESYLGFLPKQPVFPSLHTIGTLTFFVTLGAVLLFGRRVVCGWNCPCVGVRETVGFAFRADTVKGEKAWGLRHSKWFFFALYAGAAFVIATPLSEGGRQYLAAFSGIVGVTYFGSFFLSPKLGNRMYCRYLCPYGATFGLLNKVGAFRLDFDRDTCTSCGKCNKVCDMGIPVMELGQKGGKIDVADCMGCGRCVTECPSNTLAFHDARNWFRPALRQNKDWLKDLAAWNSPQHKWRAVLFVMGILSVTASVWVASLNQEAFLRTALELKSGCGF